MPVIMKGQIVVEKIKESILKEIENLKLSKISPTLATVRVGEDPSSKSYEKGTKIFMSDLGIDCKHYVYDENINLDEFTLNISNINNDRNIHGILLFKPLPDRLNSDAIDYIIDPLKDIDGTNPINLGKLMAKDKTAHAPCTAEAVIRMLEYFDIDVEGKNAVIIGRSLVVGKPLSMLLLDKNATVTICHSKTIDLQSICKNADILIAAIGKKEFVNKDFIKDNAVIIDVGINVDEFGKLKGDVDYEDVFDISSYITPVPKGVGNVTNAVLAEHIMKACNLL